MSRLDSFIARMQAQRDCLNFLKPAVDAVPGPLLEVGLGNGRTYDHLREHAALVAARSFWLVSSRRCASSRMISIAISGNSATRR